MHGEPTARPPSPKPKTYSAEVAAVGRHADRATTDLARVVGAAVSAGITVDDEVFEAVALLASWSSWLKGLALGTELAARNRDSS
jgi:hypothetical protein